MLKEKNFKKLICYILNEEIENFEVKNLIYRID